MIKLKWEYNQRTLRRRMAKGKLFRKKCEGCTTNNGKPVCPIPYKDMPTCPCQICLVKVMCKKICNELRSLYRGNNR